MTGPVLYSDSGRQQKCSQSSFSLIIPGITSAQLLPSVETSPTCRATSPAGQGRFSAASPAPRQSFHLRGSKSRDISQGFNRSPVRPSSRPWSPGGAGTLRLSPELSTLPLPATHLGAKTGHTDTDPGLYHRHNRTSFVQPTQPVRPRVAMLPFGRRPSLLGHPVPPGDSAPLTIGLPRYPARTRAGFPCFARVRHGWGRVPSLPRGLRCLHGQLISLTAARRLPEIGREH